MQVMWDDIIGEPEGLKSTQCAWNCSYKCFRGTRNCCYILLTTFFAPCLAFCSAINFACLAFQVSKAALALFIPPASHAIWLQHIWCMGPFLRTWKINCAFFRTCFTVCMAATCGPCAEACGLYFAKIKVRYQKLPESDGDEDIMAV